jgi:transposase, IS30 family
MSKNYHQLSSVQRYQIEALIEAGESQIHIAKIIGVHASTVSRELNRNTPKAGQGALLYRAQNAQRRTELRKREKPRRELFTSEMKQLCRDWLVNEKWSPELISVKGKQLLGYFPSHETIYRWIWYCKHSHKREHRKDQKLYLLLRHIPRRQKRGNRHDKRGNIPLRRFIEERPIVVNKRERIGDLEVDLMIGRKHQSAILVSLDRSTLKVKLRKLRSKESETVRQVLVRAYRSQSWLKTITFDNDSAFMKHSLIAKSLGVNTFFTRPYTSQDKGSVENRIGILRRFLPKKSDLSNISTAQLMAIENKLNNRPVRKFNYKSPNQVFSEKIALRT